MTRRDLLVASVASPGLLCGIWQSTEARNGTAALMRVADRRILAIQNAAAGEWALPPGSTIKPLSLLALLEAGKLKAEEEFVCPRALILNGRRLTCSHPEGLPPMNVSRAIAYSCNCAVAHWASRFSPGELDDSLLRMGFGSRTALLAGAEAQGYVGRRLAGADCQLEALGAEGIEVTPLQMLAAYRRLALRVAETQMRPVLEGLEGAVEFGTAQRAHLDHIKVAGKTGSTLTSSGAHAAWFAGFAPSPKPEVAVVVLVQGRSGGGDAAPIAGKILRGYFGERA